MENSERLGRQARLEIEPGISHLPVLKHRTAQPLVGPKKNFRLNSFLAWPPQEAMIEFQLFTDHECLSAHLCHISLAPCITANLLWMAVL